MQTIETGQIYYLNVLRDALMARQANNPSYSIRAYARDLGLNSSTLSQILNGKRSLPQKCSRLISEKLKLDAKTSTLFLESVGRTFTNIDNIKISPLDQRFMLDESYYAIIAEWEHYAVLDLFELVGFKPTTEYMCKKLNVTSERMEVVLENLMTTGLLIKNENNEFQKAHPDIRTTEDIRGEALNAAHLEELELAKTKLQEVDKELRDFSSATFALDLEKLPEAKTIIREFRQKMNALLKSGDKKEVYLLAIQFYPLSNLDQSADE